MMISGRTRTGIHPDKPLALSGQSLRSSSAGTNSAPQAGIEMHLLLLETLK